MHDSMLHVFLTNTTFIRRSYPHYYDIAHSIFISQVINVDKNL